MSWGRFAKAACRSTKDHDKYCERGIGVVAADAFCIDGKPPEAVLICLGGAVDHGECRHALELIHDALGQSLALASTVM